MLPAIERWTGTNFYQESNNRTNCCNNSGIRLMAWRLDVNWVKLPKHYCTKCLSSIWKIRRCRRNCVQILTRIRKTPFSMPFPTKDIKRQKSMGVGLAESSKVAIKSEMVYAVDRVNERECSRCGVGNFTIQHIKRCPATNHKCEYCDIMGHMENCCNQKYPERKQQMKQLRIGRLRRTRRRWNSTASRRE